MTTDTAATGAIRYAHVAARAETYAATYRHLAIEVTVDPELLTFAKPMAEGIVRLYESLAILAETVRDQADEIASDLAMHAAGVAS